MEGTFGQVVDYYFHQHTKQQGIAVAVYCLCMIKGDAFCRRPRNREQVYWLPGEFRVLSFKEREAQKAQHRF